MSPFSFKCMSGKRPLLFLFVMALLPGALQSYDRNKLEIGGQLQINSLYQIVANQQNPEIMHRFHVLDQTALFPENYLIGDFYIGNFTDDTLKLAPQSEPLLQYLQLRYRYRNDTSSTIKSIAINSVEVKTNVANVGESSTFLPAWGQSSFLPPNTNAEISASVGWAELSKLTPGIVDFQWVYDNTEDADQDSTITPVQYKSRIKWFDVGVTPKDKIDSLYYLDFLARHRVYSADSVARGLEICQQILQLDSSYYWACLLATDALWKLGRFNEATTYALRGINLIDDALLANPKIDYDHGRYYIDILNDRIEFIQNHEPYRRIKRLHE